MSTDPKISRWSQLTRFTIEQVSRLHEVEREYAERHHKERPNSGKFRVGEIAGMWYMEKVNLNLGPFWPPRTPTEHRDSEMRRFDNAIFKLWRPLEKKWQNCEMSEMEYMHTADLRIHGSHFEFKRYSDASGGVTSKWAKTEKQSVDRGCPND